MIVWGEHDDIIPVKHAYNAHNAIPGSRLEILEDIGHFPQSEAPELFLEVLTDFLDTTKAGVTARGSLHDLIHD